MTKHVVITTKFAGCFFGDLKGKPRPDREDNTLTVTLENARCAIAWNTTGGFGELATVGPNEGSRLGTKVSEICLPGVTAVVACSPAAVKQWLKK